MKCPECNKEMSEVQAPQISAKEVMEEGKLFPVKLICYVIHVFGCDDCAVRATKTETKDYYASDSTDHLPDGL